MAAAAADASINIAVTAKATASPRRTRASTIIATPIVPRRLRLMLVLWVRRP